MDKQSFIHTKLFLILTCILSLLFALGTHWMLINNSFAYYLFDDFTPIALFIFPVLSLIVIVFCCSLIFKYNKISFLTPVAISLIGCLLAFVLADSSFSSKIQSDFLKKETVFNQIIDDISTKDAEGTYEIDVNELNFIAPEQKVIVKSVGNGKMAYCVVTIDLDDRFEGYVYDPYGSPDDWLQNGEYSLPLDIENKWSYFVYNKGVNYD